MVFVNILVFCSPNYSKNTRINTVKRSISTVDQFIILYKSIKKNWHFPYRITLCNSIEFNDVDRNRLDELDIDIFFVDPDIPELPFYCRGACFRIDTTIIGTHRLVLDADMIALNEPELDYTVDFQAMFAGSLLFNNNDIKYIANKYNLKKTFIVNNNAKGSLYKRYFNDEKDIYPYFNGGAILIKEELSSRFAELWTPTLLLSTNKGWNNKSVPHMKKHFGCQLTIGLTLLTLTNNWKPFKKGFNFIGKIINLDDFGRDNISLYHYCGTGGLEIAKKNFPDYFN